MFCRKLDDFPDEHDRKVHDGHVVRSLRQAVGELYTQEAVLRTPGRHKVCWDAAVCVVQGDGDAAEVHAYC